MLFTLVMLGVVYLAFLAFMYYYAGISTMGMVIIAEASFSSSTSTQTALCSGPPEPGRSPKAKPLSFMPWSLGSVP